MSGRDAGPSEWSSRALTRRLADYLVNAYTDGRGYDPTDLDDVEVTLRDGFDIVLGEMHEAQRDRSDGGGSEDSTTASECPATAEPPSAPVTASGGAEAEAARLRAALESIAARSGPSACACLRVAPRRPEAWCTICTAIAALAAEAQP